jgi:hypothetical protein
MSLRQPARVADAALSYGVLCALGKSPHHALQLHLTHAQPATAQTV